MELDNLERLVRTYGVPLERAALKEMLADPDEGAEFARWVVTNLGPDTLLSRDETAR